MTRDALQRRKHVTAGLLLTVVAAMVGLAFASVPLYRMFCKAVGLGGTTQTAERGSDQVLDIPMTVRFDANTDKRLPWDFKPTKKSVDLKLGETVTISYRAKNVSDHPTTGAATFNVTPEKIGQYFNKLECFCFREQTLAPGEEAEFWVKFFVDPKLVADKTTEEVRTITLSYTFFPSLNGLPDIVADAQTKTISMAEPAKNAN